MVAYGWLVQGVWWQHVGGWSRDSSEGIWVVC